MDAVSPQILAAVCSYLPQRDRLAARQLSSKFGCVACDPPYIAMLTLQQDKNTFSFTVKFQRKQKERRNIEIIKQTQKNDFVFTKSVENTGKKTIHKTKILCNRPSYHKFIDIYMNLFIRDCFLKIITLANLNDNFLAKLRKTIHKCHPHLNWAQEKRRLEMHTKQNLTQEQRTFLSFCKNPHLLRFSPPKDFTPPADFWNIPAICNTKQLVLNFGGEVGSNWRGKDTIQTDLGIDSNFVSAMLNGQKDLFICNTVTNITLDFLMNSISECVNGKCCMFNLNIRHNYSYEELDDLSEFLYDKGFVVQGYDYIVRLRGTSREGWHPDQFIIRIYTNMINLLNDSSNYRGQMSVQNPTHPFN